VFTGDDAILAADIGGTNLRVGIVKHNASKKSDLSKATVWKLEHWKHALDKPTREEAIERIAAMMTSLIGEAVVEKVQAGAVRRHRLPRHHRRAGRDPARRPEPAGQLGGRRLQPAAAGGRPPAQDRRRGRRWW
jgi:hypothetical protein